MGVFIRSLTNTNNVATVYTYLIDLMFEYAVRMDTGSNS